MSSTNRKHILVVPVPFFGHIIPTFGLAKRLHEYAKITFAVHNVMLNVMRKRGVLTTDDEKIIDIVGIEDGYPPEATDMDLMKNLKDGFEKAMFLPVRNFIKSVPHSAGGKDVRATSTGIHVPVDAVIGDLFLSEPMTGCLERGTPYFLFHTASAATLQSFLNITENTPVHDGKIPVFETFFFLRPESKGPQFPIHPAIKEDFLTIKNHIKLASGILFNSSREIDIEDLKLLSGEEWTKHFGLYCVGPIIPKKNVEKPQEKLLGEKQVRDWLDEKTPKSVVYVSFGTLAMLTEDNVAQIGAALLTLKTPFLFSLPLHLHQYLPAALQSVTGSANGMGLVLPWVPQKAVLAHPATQLFISHCGWNSSIESMFYGIPVVGWPFFADQLENALYLRDLGTAISLLNLETAGLFDTPRKRIVEGDIVKAVHEICATGDSPAGNNFKCSVERWSERLRASVARGAILEKEVKRLMADALKNTA